MKTGAQAIDKALTLFTALLREDAPPLSELAAREGIPVSTAQRMVGAFLRHGMLSRVGPGRYAPGLALGVEARGVLERAGRPLLRQLARALGATAHLGVLSGEMVTYVVKEYGGGEALLTREGSQFEAYCSGIGKVLLAAQGTAERAAYLAGGPFVRLTPATVTDPAALGELLRQVAQAGHATDRAEFEEGLYCLAAPVRGPGGRVVAGLSVSARVDICGDADWLGAVRQCAARLGRRLGGR